MLCDEGKFLKDIEMANGTSVAGTWAYRSYINTSDQPVFGAGIFTFQTPTATVVAWRHAHRGHRQL